MKRIVSPSRHSHERPSSIWHPRPPAEPRRVARERIDAELLGVRRRARGEQQVEVVLRGGAQARLARPAAPRSRRPGWPGRSSRGGGIRRRASLPQLADRTLLADHHRARRARAPRERAAALARRARRWRRRGRARSAGRVAHADELPEPAARDVLEEDALDRILGAEVEDLVSVGSTARPRPHTLGSPPCRSTSAPSPATTPRRASSPATRCARKYIAETYFDDAVQRNSERGMLGYTGTFEGKPISVQSSGMGCPSAAIVIEELVQLGVKRIIRVGTCGGLQPHLRSAT